MGWWEGNGGGKDREGKGGMGREGGKGRGPQGLVHTPMFEILKNTLLGTL